MNNLVLRAITGSLFVLVLVGSIIYGPISFTILFAIITGMTVWEFSTNVNEHDNAAVNRLINATGGVYLFLAFSYYCSGFGQGYSDPWVFAPYIITLLFLPISELYLKHKDPLKSWAYAFASQLYIAIPFSLLNVMAYHFNAFENKMDYNWILPLSIFIFLWTNDTGAYCVGSMLHKRFPAKLFERISPNKSWIGSIGGGLFCLAAAAIINYFAGDMTYLTSLQWLGLGLVVCVFGTWGDLVESLFKRELGIKDSGKILPGHGGMLDRFDSSLLAIPAAVLYLYTLNFFA